jgi:hypothetical protein
MGLPGGWEEPFLTWVKRSALLERYLSQALGFLPLRLFQHDAVENSATHPLLAFATAAAALSSRRVAQLLNLLGFPGGMVDQGAQPFRSAPFPKPIHIGAQFREQGFLFLSSIPAEGAFF